jgi:hypothetical protein
MSFQCFKRTGMLSPFIYVSIRNKYILNKLHLRFCYSTSMQWIINAAYNQRSLQSTPLLTAWIKTTYLRPVGDRCAHFSYCKHNILGSGLKWKNGWRWLYDALIIYCVACIIAEPHLHIVKSRVEKRSRQTRGRPLGQNERQWSNRE